MQLQFELRGGSDNGADAFVVLIRGAEDIEVVGDTKAEEVDDAEVDDVVDVVADGAPRRLITGVIERA